MAVGAHFGVAKFTRGSRLYLATELGGHGLHAIANAQHGQAEFKHGIGCTVIYLVNAGMAARQDDALQVAVFGVLAHPIAGHIAGVNLTKHMGFAHTAGDELGDLGAEIENEDFLVRHK